MAMECKEQGKLPSFSTLDELKELLEEGYQAIIRGEVYTLEEVKGELDALTEELVKSSDYETGNARFVGN